jgi:glucosamine 6-phosphate synthetase-like amidotransferase/phosphosugar isomerase protein
MCGIVAYFGGAGNPLTRILTGMSAIIYRAPDSTGIGLFGDDREPIRLRKSLGSVVQLLGALQTDAVYVRPEAVMTRLLTRHGGTQDLEDRQQALLRFEGFETLGEKGFTARPAFDALVDREDADPARLAPGSPGRALFRDEYRVRSRKDLSTLIQTLIDGYDMSPLVIHTLIRGALADTIARRRATDAVGAAAGDILAAFDDLFEATRVGARVKQLRKRPPPDVPKPPSARKALWQNLIETVVRVPADYNRDGVCCLFRLLDAVLLSRMAADPTLTEALDRALDTMWLPSQRPQRVDWRTLYAVEKGLNVYGWAGAAALTHLQQEVFFPIATQKMQRRALMTAESMVPGQTDPQLLRYLATPIIAHGRWAMQSAVTVENAHPFPDARLRRALALNGQFDSRVEARLRTFLETVAGHRLRSENSAEYAAILWGYFYDQLQYEQQHSEVVRRQVDNDMTDIAMGSHSIDYQVVQRVRGRSESDLDRMAFVAAARQIVKDGGQIATVGISLVSPRQLFVASHNRPVFVVRRLENDDFMVVSDINAALGLFPQGLIETTINALDNLEQRRRKTLAQMPDTGGEPKERRTSQARFAEERARLLAPFAVEVHPLDGEEIFALVQTALEKGNVCRAVTISDFDGNPLPDVEPFETQLDPVTVRKDGDRSFHETHLREIPERFRYILDVYSPDVGSWGPADTLNIRTLHRRFGPHLQGLRRLVLVGTGSNLHMAGIVRSFLLDLMPEIAVDVLRPGEIENPRQRILPQQDLVVMLSWSSTTAEMVQLAQQLLHDKVLMVAITEKRFADMALAAAKSGGVMPVFSGEEVTIASIKSALCTLLCLHLLTAWIGVQKKMRESLDPVLNVVNGLPERIDQLNNNHDVIAFSQLTAKAIARASAIIAVSAPEASGIGNEVALKIEEASWYALGQWHTYDDLLGMDPGQWSPGRFVMVHASQRRHIDAAVAVIEKLAAAGIDMAVVTCPNRHQERMQQLCKGRCLVLPWQDDISQAYLDLAFYYRLSLDVGLACGHGAGVAPRNRSKSSTVTRSRPKTRRSPTAELKRIAAATPAKTRAAVAPCTMTASPWEAAVKAPGTRRALGGLHRLADQLRQEDPLTALGAFGEEDLRELGRCLFDTRSEVNGILAVSLDTAAQAAFHDAAAFWRRLITLPFRELPTGEWPRHLPEDVLLLIISTGHVPSPTVNDWPEFPGRKIVSVGVGPPSWKPSDISTAGHFVLPPVKGCCATAQVYAGLNLLLARAWHLYAPQRAATVEDHMIAAGQVIGAILQDDRLLDGLQRVAADNARYRSGFFISPFAGAGRVWERAFDDAGCMMVVHHPPGKSGHGPIVTIDGHADGKFVDLTMRDDMVARYGETVVARWEAAYLEGNSVDAFLTRPPAPPLLEPQVPFYAGHRWFLPVLKPDYDTRQDNLIILDMTGERALPAMLDELSLLGSRLPRLVVITQEDRLRQAGADTFFSFPVSNLLVLPTVAGMPIADLHLPLALEALGVTLADLWQAEPPNQ